MKIEAGRTFVLFSRWNVKRGKKFKGLFMARKAIDTDQLPQLPVALLERYLREEGYIQNIEFNEWVVEEQEPVPA